MEDPCPIEIKKTVKQRQAEHEAEKQGLVKTKKKRNLKDKERVLYAPYTNIGSMNFEKTTGYINIPDQNVVYTRIDDEDEAGLGDGLGGVDATNTKDLNEGQKIVFKLQDMEKTMNTRDMEQPMLLGDIKLEGNDEQKQIADELITVPEDFGFKAKIEAQKSMDQQTLFREREVDSLKDLIYGKQDEEATAVDDEDELHSDTLRFDISPIKLERFKGQGYKRLLKKKFVTGMAKDKILENLLNMSDSEGEGKDADGTEIDKDQIRRLEDNERKGTKFDKKRKRMENKGFKVETDSDEASEELNDDSEGDEKKIKDEKIKQMEMSKEHKPIKKSDMEIKKSQFLGEKYGHFKMGVYVRIEMQVEKKFAR